MSSWSSIVLPGCQYIYISKKRINRICNECSLLVTGLLFSSRKSIQWLFRLPSYFFYLSFLPLVSPKKTNQRLNCWNQSLYSECAALEITIHLFLLFLMFFCYMIGLEGVIGHFSDLSYWHATTKTKAYFGEFEPKKLPYLCQITFLKYNGKSIFLSAIFDTIWNNLCSFKCEFEHSIFCFKFGLLFYEIIWILFDNYFILGNLTYFSNLSIISLYMFTIGQ